MILQKEILNENENIVLILFSVIIQLWFSQIHNLIDKW